MTIGEIKEMVNGDQYDFLRSNEHLRDKIIFLTLGGSYAYGTNVETSDIDIRGCALNSRSDVLGLSNFEQVVDNKTDTTIYSFNKLVKLLINCNPNVIEVLGCKPEHYIQCSEIGQELIDNRKLFLSQKAINSFGGYANQQLRRLENALARDKSSQSKKEEHILQSMNNVVKTFAEKYNSFHYGDIKLYTGISERENMDTEVYIDINLAKYPARDLVGLAHDLNNVISSYDKFGKRNHKKDDAHLNKHAMHLIRLYLMCIDILEKEDIITYRSEDHDLLMNIRSGVFQKDDGTYRSEFFEMVNDYEERLHYAQQHTNLPKKPNMKLIEELVIDINRRSINA